MKKLLMNNLGYKLFSFIIAVLLWILVVNNENPVTTRTYSNVPVTVTNSEIVTNKGNTYQISEESKYISVKITAQRSVISQLSVSNIKAIADMANLDTYSGTLIPIEVTVPGYNITSAEASPKNVNVKIEMESTKAFPIVPKSTGKPRDGYVVGGLTVEPKEIEVSGPESLVDSISQVVAEVSVSGISSDKTIETEVIFYDEDNVMVDTTLLRHNLGDAGVSVNVSVYQAKMVPIEFDTSAIDVLPGYVYEGITIEPQEIEIVGPIDELEKIDKFEIPREALQISGLKKTEKMTIDVREYLPEWAIQIGESSEIPVIVKIHVTKTGTKTYEFATGAISLVNVPKGYKVDYGNLTTVEIVVKGPKEELEKMQLASGNVSINLIDISEEGKYRLPLQVALKDNLKLYKEVMIDINVKKIEENE